MFTYPTEPTGKEPRGTTGITAQTNYQSAGTGIHVGTVPNSNYKKTNTSCVQDTSSGASDGQETGSTLGGMSDVASTSGAQTKYEHMGPNFSRCKAARNAKLQHKSTFCGLGQNAGVEKMRRHLRIGNLEDGLDAGLALTFRGSRIGTKESIVNESISISFDPATLTCLVCEKPHNIIDDSLVVVVCDQNFVPVVKGTSTCLPVIRMEDASLQDLFKLTLEVFDKKNIPIGTHFVVGSASQLTTEGTTLYTLELQKFMANISARWKNATVSCLPPIISADCGGTVYRQIIELNSWLKKVHGVTTLYHQDVWNMLIEKLSSKHDQFVELGHTDTYILPMPKSLTDPTLMPFNFHTDSSLVMTSGLDDQATFELLGALLEQLHSNFGCKAHPTDLVCGELAELKGPPSCDASNSGTRLIILGGSHCRRSVHHYTEKGHRVIDLTKPGWMPTPSNIEEVLTELNKLGDLRDCVAVLDLLSNAVYRYEHFDGQLLLAEKKKGRHHMLGRVTVCPKNLLANILLKLKPILDMLPCMKICLPPLPRYLFSSCCSATGHCEGVGQPGHALELFQKCMTLRKHMRELLTGRHTRLMVPELFTEMFPDANSPSKQLEELRKISEDDGVHLTPEGYLMWSTAIMATFDPNTEVAETNIGEKPASYFWRGFVSPHGADRPKNMGSYHNNRTPGGGRWDRDHRHKGGRGGQGHTGRGGGGRGGRGGRGMHGGRFKPY